MSHFDSPNNYKLLIGCMNKLENLTFLFATGINTSSHFHATYWGYLLGRTTQLLRKINISTYWKKSVSQMNINKVQWIVRSKLPSSMDALINYGFCIGFCQEYFEETPDKWWEPLVPHLNVDHLDVQQIQLITAGNLPQNLALPYMFELGGVFDPMYPIKWLDVGKELRAEHGAIKTALKLSKTSKL